MPPNGMNYTDNLAVIGERLARIEERMHDIPAIKDAVETVSNRVHALPCKDQQAFMTNLQTQIAETKGEVNGRLGRLWGMFWAIVSAFVIAIVGLVFAFGKTLIP